MEKRFRALVEYEDGKKVWEYYTTFQEPAWLDTGKIIVKDLQFTGLISNEGLTPVFEGDVVKDELVYLVEFGEYEFNDSEHFGWRLQPIGEHKKYGAGPLSIHDAEVVTVVGNIYENPDLLK